MSDIGGVVAPEINAGQQLVGLYQEVWSAEASWSELHVPPDPASGLKESAKEFQLTRDALEELSPDELAEIGKNGLRAYFDAETRAEDRKQALCNKIEAEKALRDSVKLLAGSRVTVEALQADDKPIHVEPDNGKWRGRSLATVTGILTPDSTVTPWFQFTPGELRLNRSLGFRLMASHYVVQMRNPDTDEPRVALTINSQHN